MEYRETIGIGKKYTFGTELEFTAVNLEKLKSIFAKTDLPIRYEINHKWGLPKYDVWYLDEDSTITKHVLNCPIGGELSSRILIDEKQTWQEIKRICEILVAANAQIEPNCSNHIHVSLANITNKPLFFEILSKLIAILEDEIDLFFMGDTYLRRTTKQNYARDLKAHLLNYINEVNFQDEEGYFFDMRNGPRGITLFSNRDAINLNNFYERGLMEVRYPNGTLNPKTIQNNINFLLKLIDAIERNLFDSKELTAQVEETKKSDWFLPHYGKYNTKGFEQLVNTISTSSEDVNDFMTQYEHVLSKKKSC